MTPFHLSRPWLPVATWTWCLSTPCKLAAPHWLDKLHTAPLLACLWLTVHPAGCPAPTQLHAAPLLVCLLLEATPQAALPHSAACCATASMPLAKYPPRRQPSPHSAACCTTASMLVARGPPHRLLFPQSAACHSAAGFGGECSKIRSQGRQRSVVVSGGVAPAGPVTLKGNTA
jgi:hypothetical protein